MNTGSYVLNEDDPVAPTEAEWESMLPADRKRVAALLPVVVEHDFMSEGDLHARVTLDAGEMIRNHFGGRGGGPRRHYIGRSIMTWYPGQRGFAPDLFVVFDVDDHERDSWIVALEGRGLDVAFEVIVKGDRVKDLERNVIWFAELGITEYFVLDAARRRVHGFRLLPGPSSGPDARYERLVPQLGRMTSEVLGLDIGAEGNGFRFYVGAAPVPTDREIRRRLEEVAAAEERERLAADQARAEADAARAEADAARAEAEARVRSLEAELAALRAQLIRS